MSMIFNKARPGLEIGKTIQLPEAVKRKLPHDNSAAPQQKKIIISQGNQTSTVVPMKTIKSASTNHQSSSQQHTTTAQLMQVKQDREDQLQQQNQAGINIITIAGHNANLSNGGGATSSTAATVASSSTNGFSPRIEDIDFRNDIIFDAGTGINGSSLLTQKSNNEIINLGNFDNSLPPTFFKNLCNSSRHEALGLYVANVMNRLNPRSAAKLELGILKAIINVQSDALEQESEH